MTELKSLIRQSIENDIANKKYNPMNDVLIHLWKRGTQACNY